MTDFSAADQLKLDELIAKKKAAQNDARNRKKADERVCQRLFGMSIADIKSAIAGTQIVSADTSKKDDKWTQIVAAYDAEPDKLFKHIMSAKQINYYKDYVKQ